MKRLFIHIGTPKTGSTQIQKTLSKHSNTLLQEKIVNIKPKKLHKSIHSLDTLSSDQLSILQKNLLDITNRYSIDYSFVISHESLCGFKKNKLDPQPFAERLSRLCKSFKTKIILYLRRQDLFFESIYTQYIQEGDCYSFEDFLSDTDPKLFDWLPIISAFAMAFGDENIVIRKYDKAFLPTKHSLIEDFSRIIQSEILPKEKILSTYNSGYNSDALQVALLCNKYFNSTEKADLRYLLQSYNTKTPFESYQYFSRESRQKFLKIFKHSNEIIQENFFTDDLKGLFSQDSPLIDPPKSPDLTEALVRVTMRTLIGITEKPLKKDKQKPKLISKILFKLKTFV